MLVLRDYQKQAVETLKSLPASALYFGTGTGKTLTSLELIKNFPVDNLLVICPHNAIGQWQKTIKDYYPYYDVIDWKKSWTTKKITQELRNYEYSDRTALVINYDKIALMPILQSLINKNWVIILDESHRIKNYGTARNPVKTTEAILRLGNNTIYKVTLTATPTQGDFGGYIDYYSQLKFLGYIDCSLKEFNDNYVITKDTHVGLPFPIKTIIGYVKVDEIEGLLKFISLSYRPKYGDLEPQFIEVVLEKTKTYNKTFKEKSYKDIAINNSARSRIMKKTLTTGRVQGYDMMRRSKEYVDNTIKLDWLRDFVKDADSPVIVLYNYNVELKSLIEFAKSLELEFRVINGQTKDKFEEIQGEWDIVFGQYQAISEALDGLQYKSNIIVFFAMPESSILYRQALGRIDRIGQTKTPMYYFLLMEKTIDMEIMNNIKNKIEFSEETLNKLEVDYED